MMLLGLLGIGMLVTGAVDAPITSVTVYSDRVRVVRTARLNLSGTQRVELPLLRGGVDTSSIRVEAEGAEVARVDLRFISAEAFTPAEIRKVLDELDTLDDQLARNQAEREACSAQLSALKALSPEPRDDGVPLPRLDSSGWAAATTFLLENTGKLQERLRALNIRSEDLSRERELRLDEARELGATPLAPGLEVAPTLVGNGPVRLRVTYVAPNARWFPRYELQLLPASNKVRVSFFGLVSQETGEDWKDTEMTLSTAIPATATTLPRLATWKIGQRERFVPTPAPREVAVLPPPPVPPALAEAPGELDRLRERLFARIQRPAPSSSPSSQPASSQSSASSQPAPVQGQMAKSVIIGTVKDAMNHTLLADVVVTASSPSASEEFVVVTDAQGNYRIPNLPTGIYTLRFEAQGFKPFARADVTLGYNRTVRVNIELLEESFSEEIVVAGAPPSIDVGSTTMGINADQDFINRVAIRRPDVRGGGRSFESVAEYVPTVGVGLAPPEAYQRPVMDPNLPASLAGGYDLAFPAARSETVPSGASGRQVPLFAETWPVKVERRLFPAITKAAFLVAELQSPSKQVLPGGEASLFVGTDPAGTASLNLVAPGERFTLPLGVDQAVRPIRNVTLVQSEKGFISKDEETAYRVTIEVANPYAFPLPVRIHDQWPLARGDDVEVKLVRTEPYARQDPVKGLLEWELTVPASGKTVATFEYTLRHPKGWRMHQTQ